MEREEKEMNALLSRKKGWFSFLAMALGLTLAMSSVTTSYAASAKEIDTSVDVALDRFFKQVNGAKEFAKNAKGLLVMPGVVKAGLGIAGEYGQGALRIGGKTANYYNIAGASIGLTIGGRRRTSFSPS